MTKRIRFIWFGKLGCLDITELLNSCNSFFRNFCNFTMNSSSASSLPPDPVRLDAWLWAVRCFKTRSQAANACRKGSVWIRGIKAKPSRELGVGDLVELRQPFVTRRLRVKALLRQRVGAKLVPEFCVDETPAEELDRARELEAAVRAGPRFDPGAGRPTKRNRREWERRAGEADSAADADPTLN
jgi:ribosome-associated heat shock protein Hsp15